MTCRSSSSFRGDNSRHLFYAVAVVSIYIYGFVAALRVAGFLLSQFRSFDHMLGWLKTLNPEIDGLTGTECNRPNTTITNSLLVCVSDIAEFVDPDPGHSFQAIREQFFG
ncbi:unnamed protein product [Sphagnum troendelagicum]|uniref:Uncharacterized protein n=1 Tax=Sphagnum troendelagicum TaxID=128251 RepID=A0ABP0UER2_9BRYO